MEGYKRDKVVQEMMNKMEQDEEFRDKCAEAMTRGFFKPAEDENEDAEFVVKMLERCGYIKDGIFLEPDDPDWPDPDEDTTE